MSTTAPPHTISRESHLTSLLALAAAIPPRRPQLRDTNSKHRPKNSRQKQLSHRRSHMPFTHPPARPYNLLRLSPSYVPRTPLAANQVMIVIAIVAFPMPWDCAVAEKMQEQNDD